jgi:hypothetical protein
MQLEAKEPVDRRFATVSQAAKNPMFLDAPIVAHRELGGVDKRHASAGTETGMQVYAQRNQRRRKELHKARVADETGKLAAQLDANVLGVERFEGAIVTLMEQDQNSHNLRECQFSGTLALLGGAGKTPLVPPGFKDPAKIIDMTKEFEYTHG